MGGEGAGAGQGGGCRVYVRGTGRVQGLFERNRDGVVCMGDGWIQCGVYTIRKGAGSVWSV